MSAEMQDDVIRFLSDPATYDLDDGRVERVETHCSIVFLAGECAYKLKRAIRYAALDYTTLALRQRACAAELTLNRRTAPDLYVGVRTVTRDSSGRLAFNGTGPIVDCIVVMHRFAQSDLFDRLAGSGGLTSEIMCSLGASIARFHAATEITPAHGGSEAISRVVAANDHELAKVGTELDGVGVGALSECTEAALHRVAPLLDRRRAEGKVRRCHGDLRLANICLFAGRPTMFDCIEFNDEISCIDVLYDLAFLLMDLHMLGRDDLGNAAFNAYLDASPESEGLRALPLFLALRAATRSYALAGSARRRRDRRQATRLLASARHHIDAGQAFLALPAPTLIALGGEPEERRHALAGMLASLASPVPGARRLSLTERGDARWQVAREVLAAGCSVLIDDDFTDAPDREDAAEVALRSSVRFFGFWLGPPPIGLDRSDWRVADGTFAAAAAAAPLIASGASA